MRPRPHLLHDIRLWLDVAYLTTLPAPPRCIIFLKSLHRILDLRAKIRTHKGSLMHLLSTALTIPPQAIHFTFRSRLLNDDTNRIREPDRVVRCVARQEEQLALIDVDVHKLALLHRLQQHTSFVLVEEFRRLVDVVVGSCVGTADDHDGHGIAVDAVVVDWWLEEMGVFVEPFGEVERHAERLFV